MHHAQGALTDIADTRYKRITESNSSEYGDFLVDKAHSHYDTLSPTTTEPYNYKCTLPVTGVMQKLLGKNLNNSMA